MNTLNNCLKIISILIFVFIILKYVLVMNLVEAIILACIITVSFILIENFFFINNKKNNIFPKDCNSCKINFGKSNDKNIIVLPEYENKSILPIENFTSIDSVDEEYEYKCYKEKKKFFPNISSENVLQDNPALINVCQENNKSDILQDNPALINVCQENPALINVCQETNSNTLNKLSDLTKNLNLTNDETNIVNNVFNSQSENKSVSPSDIEELSSSIIKKLNLSKDETKTQPITTTQTPQPITTTQTPQPITTTLPPQPITLPPQPITTTQTPQPITTTLPPQPITLPPQPITLPPQPITLPPQSITTTLPPQMMTNTQTPQMMTNTRTPQMMNNQSNIPTEMAVNMESINTNLNENIFENDISNRGGNTFDANYVQYQQDELEDKQDQQVLDNNLFRMSVGNRSVVNKFLESGGKYYGDILTRSTNAPSKFQAATNELKYGDFNYIAPLNKGMINPEYTFVSPSNWYPIPPHPPVCVTNKSCTTCPIIMGDGKDYMQFATLEDFDKSRRFTGDMNINIEYIKNVLNNSDGF